MNRKPYPSDVSDDEWAFVVPYLTLMREDAPQRDYDLRELFNALRWIIRAGAPWRMMPNDFPRWEAVYPFAHLQTNNRNVGYIGDVSRQWSTICVYY